MQPEKIKEIFPIEDLTKGFANIGDKSFEKVSKYALKSMNIHFKPHFMKLEIVTFFRFASKFTRLNREIY